MPISPIMMVHGGSWSTPDDLEEARLLGVRAAAAAGWQILARGGSALDAVEQSIVDMENDEAFDAGRGSFLNRDGRVELDALIMEGATLRAGGVGCVEHIQNPIQLARTILTNSAHVYLVGEGAERFARQQGIGLCRNEDLIIAREVDRRRQFSSQAGNEKVSFFTANHDAQGTVGALALDGQRSLAAGTSTGGTFNKAPGRVGDSSLIGCGCYADNQSAAASTTGWGEPIMKLVLAKWAADRVALGSSPEWVAKEAISLLEDRLGGHGGIILLDAKGRFGIAHNTTGMAWAVKSEVQDTSGTRRA